MVVLCGWEGNRKFGIALAMRQTLYYIHLQTQWSKEKR